MGETPMLHTAETAVLHPERRRGFTLLEILAATAMVAMLAGSLYASLHIAFKARDSATSATATVRKTDMAIEIIRADLQSAVVPNGTLAGPFVGRNVANVPDATSDDLTFYAAAMDVAPSTGIGDIKQVQYFCQPASDNNGLVLVRRLTTNLLASQTPEPKDEIVARGVTAFTVKYFDGQTWQDNWDSTTLNNVLPKAVGVDIEFADTQSQGGVRISRVILPACGVDSTAGTTSGASP
jgi:type II secretion system protein J